ncbi:MAG: DNA polymerase I, partial [Planctomycetes bacterium]|nr:DNA polymerase I [Planctomycetota bacterium]
MPKTLYIVDTHAQIFAAYYAPFSGTLTSPQGLPTKATLIFTTMLLKLLRERQPDMLVMAMDSPGPTFRHKLYKDYKANRSEIPEDLPPQIESIEEILTAMRIPIVKEQGFEADDLIGAIVTRALKEKFKIFICSSDKDLEQLIAPDVVLYNPRNGRLVDEKALMDNKGIRPDQVADVLALSGDTVDNIPGVPDVGPKTAQQWIQKYQTLDQLLAHSDQIKGKRGQNLRDHREQLDLSRQLVTLDCDAPFDTKWDEMLLKPFDLAALTKVFKPLGFNKLLVQLHIGPENTPTPV